jgi:hypothetical protein
VIAERLDTLSAGIDDALRRHDELVPLGLAQARAFTWEATGRAFLEGYSNHRA